MPDMLVKLYTLPEVEPLIAAQRAAGVDIRRALAPEKHVVVDWVRQHWSLPWASECEVTFANQPVSCFVAVEAERLVGFSCYDATCKNFFGPIGVDPAVRGRDIGRVLLLACLHAMAAQGFGYAIIGGVGPAEFYARTVGAVLIEDSTPGVYRGMLRAKPQADEHAV
ncbi:MAG TPA: GNAT family N-acetyltransferase [Herpetosiphonaceae bacterium]